MRRSTRRVGACQWPVPACGVRALDAARSQSRRWSQIRRWPGNGTWARAWAGLHAHASDSPPDKITTGIASVSSPRIFDHCSRRERGIPIIPATTDRQGEAHGRCSVADRTQLRPRASADLESAVILHDRLDGRLHEYAPPHSSAQAAIPGTHRRRRVQKPVDKSRERTLSLGAVSSDISLARTPGFEGTSYPWPDSLGFRRTWPSMPSLG
jgi:hypothetical protein